MHDNYKNQNNILKHIITNKKTAITITILITSFALAAGSSSFHTWQPEFIRLSGHSISNSLK